VEDLHDGQLGVRLPEARTGNFATRMARSRDARESSTITTSGNTPEMRAQDLHNLLEQLDARHPVLIGWSQGVQDLAAYIERYGTHDLAGLVLVDAAVADGANGIAARPQETAAQFKILAGYQAHQEEYLRGMMRAIISKPQPDGTIDRLVATGMKTPPTVGTAMLVADLFGVNRTAALKKIDCPTLIVASARSDELARQQAGASQISHARFEKIEDAAPSSSISQSALTNCSRIRERPDDGFGGFNAVDCEPGKHQLHL